VSTTPDQPAGDFEPETPASSGQASDPRRKPDPFAQPDAYSQPAAAPEPGAYSRTDAYPQPGGYPQPGAYPQPDAYSQQPGPYPQGQYPAQFQQGPYQQGQPYGGYGYGSGYPEQRSRLVAGLLGILLGSLGIHRFYLGYVGIGIAQIIVTFVTFGLGALWGFIEGILILVGAESFRRDAKGVPLKE
jgi:hypothetical protein